MGKLRRPGAVGDMMARLAALSEWLGGRDYLLGRFTAADILMTTVLRLIRHTDLVGRVPPCSTPTSSAARHGRRSRRRCATNGRLCAQHNRWPPEFENANQIETAARSS